MKILSNLEELPPPTIKFLLASSSRVKEPPPPAPSEILTVAIPVSSNGPGKAGTDTLIPLPTKFRA